MKRMGKSNCIRRNFTLVEVIAVLIILGILLAIAVPKYFALTETAKQRAADGALAEGKSVCSLVYGQLSLVLAREPTLTEMVDGVAAPTVVDGLDTYVALGTNEIAGDWTYTFAAVATGIDIGVTGTGDMAGTTKSSIWETP